MNNITIELSAEDRALLKRIADNLEAFKTSGGAFISIDTATPKTEPAPAPQKPEEVTEPTSAQPVEEEKAEPAPEPQTDKEEGVPQVTLDDVRQVVVHLAANGKKAEARAIVTKYAKSVGEIPADKVGEVFKELRAVVLEG